MAKSGLFSTTSGFCADCGSILPLMKQKGNVKCYTCPSEYSADAFQNMKMNYTIHFNSRDSLAAKASSKEDGDEDEGAVVDRKCPHCGNEKMSYTALQLRSADEGQTIFYTCTECKFKESENS